MFEEFPRAFSDRCKKAFRTGLSACVFACLMDCPTGGVLAYSLGHWIGFSGCWAL